MLIVAMHRGRSAALEFRLALVGMGRLWLHDGVDGALIAVANRNRGALPSHLPRYEVIIDMPQS
jgi:hypothetical protein